MLDATNRVIGYGYVDLDDIVCAQRCPARSRWRRTHASAFRSRFCPQAHAVSDPQPSGQTSGAIALEIERSRWGKTTVARPLPTLKARLAGQEVAFDSRGVEVAVVPGDYEVVIEYVGGTVQRCVRVDAGETTVVTVEVRGKILGRGLYLPRAGAA
jgi:hypothetical protein